MLQVLQDLSSGDVEVSDVPAPAVLPGTVLVRNHYSLISSGTERMILNFGRASYLEKARQHPDKVKQVIAKIKTDGLLPTIKAVRGKLDQPVASGYSCAGEVIAVGEGITGLKVGDRVAGNGYHAMVVRLPQNLCVKVPDNVGSDEAAFNVVGAIPLQGLRLAAPTLGESFAVTGLGLLGLICVQLLRAHGCRVLGIDVDPARLALAEQFGAHTVNAAADDAVSAALHFSRSRGVDGVMVCAGGSSSDMINQAAEMCRVRGRVIQVGVTGLELVREKFFRKEILLQVSNAAGPGKADPTYEQLGVDYPVGFVRWTEQRNAEAVLDMMAGGQLDVKPLISHRFPVADASKAYEIVGGAAPSLGVLLQYPASDVVSATSLRAPTVSVREPSGPAPGAVEGTPTVGFVGSGNYATAVLIPAFKAAGARLKTVASSGGVSGVHAARKFGIEQTTTDTAAVLADADVNTVVITTRHDSHAKLVCQALAAGKHVFVEKPLALKLEEVDAVEEAYRAAAASNRAAGSAAAPLLMVGFNRRFAPQVRKMKTLIEGVTAPKSFVMTANAGAIPVDHWTQDPVAGGGRIIGEACHFIDLLRFLAGVPIESYAGTYMESSRADTASLQLRFVDGSIGTIHYFANGDRSYPKERLEIFAAGRVLQMNNFRALTGFGWPGFSKMNLWQQDKGQAACAAAFVRAVAKREGSPIAFDELMEVSRVTIGLARALG